MPELPEVETVRNGLKSAILGRRILKAKAFTQKLRIPVPGNFSQALKGRKVVAITRRAKFLRLHLDNGHVLLLHLGMSGSVLISSAKNPYVPAKHDHALLEFEGEKRFVFNDPRRFGLIAFAEDKTLDAHPFFKDLGPEPLSEDFSGKALKEALQNRTSAIKLLLLDQGVVAGVGNIYASEALFRAGINPKRRASSVSLKEASALAHAVKEILQDAIASGGSSLKNHVSVEGDLGNFQHHFRVYGREGEPCVKRGCKGTIKRIVQGARSTYFCPVCQR